MNPYHHDSGFIRGTRENVKRLLLFYFTFEERQTCSEHTIVLLKHNWREIFSKSRQSSLNIEFVKPWRPICCLTGLLCSKTRTLRWICISPSRSSAVPSPIPLRQQFHIYIYSCIFFPFVMRCLQYEDRAGQSYRMPVKVRGGQRY